jgi:hypothetical protein
MVGESSFNTRQLLNAMHVAKLFRNDNITNCAWDFLVPLFVGRLRIGRTPLRLVCNTPSQNTQRR